MLGIMICRGHRDSCEVRKRAGFGLCARDAAYVWAGGPLLKDIQLMKVFQKWNHMCSPGVERGTVS